MTPELEHAIGLGYERRDRDDMAPTIAYFEDLLARHPDHPVAVFELAGAYDTDGQEGRARALYERALELGLAGDRLRRCLRQYGSTLRWLGLLDESLAVLERARRQFPDSDAVRVCLALTLDEAGRADGSDRRAPEGDHQPQRGDRSGPVRRRAARPGPVACRRAS